jgi:hypothetical protein
MVKMPPDHTADDRGEVNDDDRDHRDQGGGVKLQVLNHDDDARDADPDDDPVDGDGECVIQEHGLLGAYVRVEIQWPVENIMMADSGDERPDLVATPMQNGTDGVKTIETLMEKRGKFDYIMLDTTELTDPAPVTGMFWPDGKFGADVCLDA